MGIYIAMIFLTLGFIVSILWAVIDWGALIRRKLANNPARGRIYYEYGEDLKLYDAKRIDQGKKADTYEYKIDGKAQIAIVPRDYPLKYVNGRRAIAICDGEVVAWSLLGKEYGKDLNGPAIAALTLTGVITDLVESLTAHKKIPWWVWAILGVGIIVAIAFFLNRGSTGVGNGAVPGGNGGSIGDLQP
jgi:hypothetical protein